jgi:hypothetical protein
VQRNGCDLLEGSFCQNVIEKRGQVMNLSECIRFKSGTNEPVYRCLCQILQFFLSDCMKIKQDGYRNFVSWLVFLTGCLGDRCTWKDNTGMDFRGDVVVWNQLN